MLVLGINTGYLDASAAILEEGRLLAAFQEERFNRVKHSAGFPEAAVRACLESAGISISAIDHIAVSSKPISHMEEDVLFALSGRSTFGSALRDRLERVAQAFDVKGELARRLGTARERISAAAHEVEHHSAGLATAYLPDGEEAEGAALLSLTTFGDFASTVFGRVTGGETDILGKVLYPHSLGILYTMVCQYLGLGQLGGEGKVMGLAAHGEPTMRQDIDRLFSWKPDGTFQLELDYFTHHLRGLDMTWEGPIPAVEKIFSDAMVEGFGPPRRLGEPISQRHKDFAASLQDAVTDWVVQMAARLQRETGSDTLYLSGMLAESALLASTVQARSPFGRVVVSHAAGDAGTAIGAAFLVHRREVGAAPQRPHPYTGSAYRDADIERILRERGLEYKFCKDTFEPAARLLADGKVVGWFQDAGEFGPRALGNRSILADPRRENMREYLNSRVKFREVFLPFAASILEEHCEELLANAPRSPWMQYVGHLRPGAEEQLPAVTHVDGTVRFQSVGKDCPSKLRGLLEHWHETTGCPALLNTSFNEDGPMVRTPEEAIACFRATGMNAMIIGSFLLQKNG
jgi:carbamoyltransferase